MRVRPGVTAGRLKVTIVWLGSSDKTHTTTTTVELR